MKNIFLVKSVQCAEQRFHDPEKIFLQDPACLLLHYVGKGISLYIFHHNVSGIVLFKKIPDPDDHLMFFHFCQDARFIKILFHSPAVVSGLHTCQGIDFESCGYIPGAVFYGKIFLYSDSDLQYEVISYISDTVSPFPKDLPEQVALLQDRARRELTRQRGIFGSGSAAERAAVFIYYAVFYYYVVSYYWVVFF